MATGYTPPRYEVIRASVVALWKLKYGANADTSSDTVDGLFIDIMTYFISIGYEGTAEFYNQHNLGTATGLNIDAILAPLFNILRLAATPSTVEVRLYGTAGTFIPMLSAISTVDTGASFQTTTDVTIVAGSFAVFVLDALTVLTTFHITINGATTNITTSGDAADVAADAVTALFSNPYVDDAEYAGLQPDGRAIVFVTMSSVWLFSTDFGDAWDVTQGFAQSTDTGPIRASYGTLTRVGAPVSGWEGLTNILDATLGTREEADGAYKLRHKEAIRGIGKCTPRAVSQILKAYVGTNGAVKLYQNTSGFVVSGRPSHSFEFVIDGGDPEFIAEFIWLGHTFGTQSFGTELVTVIDEQGLVEQPRDIYFSRPNYRYIHLLIFITPGEGFPLIPLTDIQALVSQVLETWGNTLGIGRDVYSYEVGVQIGSVLSGIAGVTINLASTSTPLGSPSFGTSDLIMGELSYSRWAASRIQVYV